MFKNERNSKTRVVYFNVNIWGVCAKHNTKVTSGS